MTFECGDLERAFVVPELMVEAREHMKVCAACRREYRLWNDIGRTAKELHEEWDSPELWPQIRTALNAEPKAVRAWWTEWRTWAIAAAVFIGAIGIWLVWPGRSGTSNAALEARSPAAEGKSTSVASGDRGFLTEQALQDVEKAETAYRKSIDRLSQLAEPELQNPTSAVAVDCKERLLMLDSAITETRINLDQNRFNVHLQMELADLYRKKRNTLEELVGRDHKN